jgi:predicted permease
MASALDRWMRIASRFTRGGLEREVDEELAFHLESLAARYESEGMTAADARRRALERFGDTRRAKREAMAVRGTERRREMRTQAVDDFRQDIRYAVRQLWKRPAFSSLALGMLALGIGANTGIFSVVYGVLLKPLPFPEAERLVQVWETRLDRGWGQTSVTPGNFWDLREMNGTFEDLGAYRGVSMNLTGPEFPERLSVGMATSGFFGRVLGVPPILGRDILEEEDDLGSEARGALLSHDFWRQRYGGDAAVLGKTLTLNGDSYVVVGVLPPGTPWLDYADLYLPMPRRTDDQRASFELPVVGRLKAGVTREAGLADLERIASTLAGLYPEADAGMGIRLEGSETWLTDSSTRRALWILLGAVGFLLLIACANLANLLLAQATGRSRETAIRAAVGASRGRLLRQGLTESVFLSLLGAGLGLAVAAVGLRGLRALDPGDIPRLAEVEINGWVLAFTLVAGVLTGVATGLVPALQARAVQAAAALRSGGAGAVGARGLKRLRDALVAVEVALSLTLLVGAGLLIRSFTGLLDVDTGFQVENRLVASVSLPQSYGPEETATFLRQFLDGVRSIPQIRDVGAVSTRPVTGESTGLGIVRPDDPNPEGGIPWATWRLVTPGYFAAMGLPLRRGRLFDETDVVREGGEAGADIVISERLAQLLWPGEDPIGRTALLWAGQEDRPGRVVGVVGDMRERGLDVDPTLAVYIPYYGIPWPPSFVVHTAGDPTAVVPALRAALAEVDPSLPLSRISTLEDLLGRSLAGRRFILALVGVFAALALLLAMAGVYGVQAYAVAVQTPEIGVRVALGASHAEVMGRIVRRAMRPAVLGIGVGLAGAFGLSRLMESLLFGVTASDPLSYGGAAGVLAATALLSCWLPARRALKVDPVIAVRAE